MGINKEKYENAILYFCDKSGGTVSGITKLYKLLYFADFDRFVCNESLMSITGDEFKHMPGGPVPVSFDSIVDGMVKRDVLKITCQNIGMPNDIKTFTASQRPDISVFDDDDVAVLEYDFSKYGYCSGTELSEITHGEAPYIATDPGEIIPLELGFYRKTPFNADN